MSDHSPERRSQQIAGVRADLMERINQLQNAISELRDEWRSISVLTSALSALVPSRIEVRRLILRLDARVAALEWKS